MIRMFRMAALPASMLLAATAAHAAPDWTVSEVSGEVRLTQGGQTRAATRGALLASGATITTAAKARAVIVRGGEFVVISPGTRIRVPEANSPNKIMQLIEEWGSALFKIEKKSNPHFGVQTPYLAAVVKGTTFTVTVGQEGSQVRVSEGAVQVMTLDGAASELIPAGGAAMVGKSDLYKLTVEGKDGRPTPAGKAVGQSGAAPGRAVGQAGTPPGRAVGRTDAVPGRPAATPAAAPTWSQRDGRSDEVKIAKVIREKKIDLADVTGGLLEGGRGAELAQGEFNENSRRAIQAMRTDKPDEGKPEGGKPDNGKPEMPGKDKPDAGKPDKDKPDAGKPDKDKPIDSPGKDKPVDEGKTKPEDKGNDKPAPGEDGRAKDKGSDGQDGNGSKAGGDD